MKLEKQKRGKFLKLPDDKALKLYPIHHMHHFKSGKQVKHEIHHCFLFSKKNIGGRKYPIIHKMYKNEVYHCLASKFEGILYDHSNNIFKIAPRKLNNQIIYEIKL